MPVCVKSEIAPLRRVLLQRPGRELEHLSPETMGPLLFDDIPYLHGAQREHDCFADLLRGCGVEVSYLEELTAQVLDWTPELRAPFIADVITQAGPGACGYREALTEYLSAIDDNRRLVQASMEGVSYRELFPGPGTRLSDLAGTGSRFLMPPIPNLYFTRDPFACIGRGVSLNRMYSATRSRETVYGGYILRHHPDFADVPLYYTPHESFTIEGGDILNLSAHVLAAGVSQRTQPEAVERLAEHIFADEQSSIDTVLAFEIPRTRAFMHLDTVFTQVDRDKFTVHPGILRALRIYELTGKGEKRLRVRALSMTLAQALEHYVCQSPVRLIPCGGESEIAAEREQWNDGANTLCVRPGTVVVYDRNYVTNKILADHGVEVLKLSGSELSRGRGGPRCMSMPLSRGADPS